MLSIAFEEQEYQTEIGRSQKQRIVDLLLQVSSRIYIMQNTMIGGGMMAAWGKKEKGESKNLGKLHKERGKERP